MRWASRVVGRIRAGLFRVEMAGVENIERHVLRLTDLLIDKLQEKGCRVVSSLQPKERSGIVAFTHPSHGSKDVLQWLSDARIVVSPRAGAIRASTHLYKNEEDIERQVEPLP